LISRGYEIDLRNAKKLVLHLQDVYLSDSVIVYVEMGHIPSFPLLPGYRVALKSVIKKVSSSKHVYCQTTHFTVAKMQKAPEGSTVGAVETKVVPIKEHL
jgi:hypothetical protein